MRPTYVCGQKIIYRGHRLAGRQDKTPPRPAPPQVPIWVTFFFCVFYPYRALFFLCILLFASSCSAFSIAAVFSFFFLSHLLAPLVLVRLLALFFFIPNFFLRCDSGTFFWPATPYANKWFLTTDQFNSVQMCYFRNVVDSTSIVVKHLLVIPWPIASICPSNQPKQTPKRLYMQSNKPSIFSFDKLLYAWPFIPAGHC